MKSLSTAVSMILLGLLSVVVGCASLPRKAFDKNAGAAIRKIAILQITEPARLGVTNIGAPLSAFGLIGSLAQTADALSKGDEFTRAMKEQGLVVGAPLTQALAAELKNQQYDVIMSSRGQVGDNCENTDYTQINVNADAILDVCGVIAGYLSTAGSTSYLPWIRADVRLIRAKDRSYLYYQTFTYGADQVRGDEHFVSSPKYAYDNFTTLMESPSDAAEGITAGISLIAARLAQQLH